MLPGNDLRLAFWRSTPDLVTFQMVVGTFCWGQIVGTVSFCNQSFPQKTWKPCWGMFYYQVVAGSVERNWLKFTFKKVHIDAGHSQKSSIEFLSFCMCVELSQIGVPLLQIKMDENTNLQHHSFSWTFLVPFWDLQSHLYFLQREHNASIFVLMVVGNRSRCKPAKLSNPKWPFFWGRQTVCVCVFFGGGHGCCHFILWRVIGRAIWKFFELEDAPFKGLGARSIELVVLHVYSLYW